MADSKITALTAISTVDPTADPLVIVDVSDTSMAASGTTKKSTINQLLGSGGTATLASATITGDLTVATNRLSVSSTGVQIGTTTNKTTAFTGNGTGLTIGAALAPTIALWDTTNASYVGSISQIDADMYLTNTAVGQMVFSTDNTSRYTISSTGIATWSNVGGVAGTAMTLNSTGLGVGAASPSYKLDVNGVARVSSGGDGVFLSSAPSPDLYVVGVNYYNNNGTEGVQTSPRPSWKIEHKNSSDALAYLDIGFRAASAAASAFTSRFKIDGSGNVISNVTGTAPTLATNSQMVFNLTSNTNLRISVRGTDGVTRTANITLA